MKKYKIKINGKYYKVDIDKLLILLIAILSVSLVLVLVGHFAGGNRKKPDDPAATAETLDQEDPGYDASQGKIKESEFNGTILSKTKDAGADYVAETLFLGDSNTARFLVSYDSEGKPFTTRNNTIGVVGMGIDAISSLACMQFSTGLYTMPQAVKIIQPERIIITFGTNNLYGNSTDASGFIQRYEQQLKNIVAAYPSVDMIVNSIPPVAKVRDYPHVTMTQIDAYNRAIAEMCKKNDWKYLNSAETLKDEKTGYAKAGYLSNDGLHFSSTGLQALFEYIRTHSWVTKDDRPKPLANVPAIYGVPDGLIKTNPLNDKEFTEEATGGDTQQVPEPTPEVKETPEIKKTEEPTTVTCPDGSTAASMDACPAATVICPDGSTAASMDACPAATPTPTPQTQVTCWDGSTAASEDACPAKPTPPPAVTCWDGSTANSEAECPAKPLVTCWDGSTAESEEACPTKIDCGNGTFVTDQANCPVEDNPPADVGGGEETRSEEHTSELQSR